MDVVVNLLDVYRAKRPLPSRFDIRKLTEEGYRKNALIFACISIKATTFMDPELVAYSEDKNGDEVELPPDHILARTLAGGFGRDSQSMFFRRWSTSLDCAGAAYALKLRSQAGQTVQLRIMRPDCMRPIPDERGNIVAYEYGEETRQGYTQTDLETGKEGSGREPQVIPAEYVIHEMANPDPLDQYHGLSPIAVLARYGDLDNYAADYLRSFFLNSGIPSGILKFKMRTTDKQRQEAREKWRERFKLRSWADAETGGAFDVSVMDSDVEYEEIGSKLKMMDLSQVFGETESRICSTFGVPPILVAAYIGLLRSTYANYEQAIKHFYKATLKPNWISTADRFSIDLASEFGSNIYCKFDLSGISELQQDRTEDKKLALNAWDSGLMMKNEARMIWGLPEDAGGDIYKIGVADAFEPGAVVQNRQNRSLSSKRERLLERAPAEIHAIGDWRGIQRIAQNAEPDVKKKLLMQSTGLKIR
jgi:HK97 family phage portal protein